MDLAIYNKQAVETLITEFRKRFTQYPDLTDVEFVEDS
jgi:hypothetical protein